MKRDYKIPLLFLLVILLLGSCSNYSTYREIKSMYPRDDTGIGDLIKTDGYYYESSEEVYSPVIFTRNGEVIKYFFRFNSHEDIHESLNESFLNPSPGYYTMEQDTIKTKWAVQVYRGQYRIHEEHLVVLNDTTLQLVYYTINGEESGTAERDKLYRFYPIDVSGL